MVTITIINTVVIALAVAIHYEFLHRLSRVPGRLGIHHRYRVLVGVFGMLVAHVLEIWLFAVAFYLMLRHDGFGQLQGHFDGGLVDCAYFSLVNYTTLGYGDIVAVGPIRFLAGLEALTGLMLITWSASLLFLQMQRYWEDL